MTTRALLGALGALAASVALGDGETNTLHSFTYTPGEGISFKDQSVISAEASLAFDSRYLSYGLVDNRDPIFTPSAGLTFFGVATVGAEAIFDLTRYGRKAGYTNRAGRYTEFHPTVTLSRCFSADDHEILPTSIEIALGYQYEFHPNSKEKGTPAPEGQGDDTQFWSGCVTLVDLWTEPSFYYERDVMRDNGTYLNLELGHAFPLIDGKADEEPVLSLRPSLAQGWGDRHRIAGYLCRDDGEALRRAGLMDSMLKLSLDWRLGRNLALSGYVAYYDYIFDRHTRDAARHYEATGRCTDSFNFIGGVAISLAF